MILRKFHGVVLVFFCLLGGCSVFLSNAWLQYATLAPANCQHESQEGISDLGIELEWTAPTNNTDGSRLNNLAAYRIDWSGSDGQFDNCIWINDPAIIHYRLDGLGPGDYAFVVVAINKAGVASSPSATLRMSVL